MIEKLKRVKQINLKNHFIFYNVGLIFLEMLLSLSEVTHLIVVNLRRNTTLRKVLFTYVFAE